MDIKPFKSVQSTEEFRYEIKKSIFLAEARMIQSEEDAIEFINHVKEKHPKATHHCYAYTFDVGGLREKAEDDGEPSGTAGLPILKALKMNELQNCMIVVTRYFGGIKLGAGGLTRAYMSSATGVIEEAGIRSFKTFYDIMIDVGYDLYDILLNYINNAAIQILDTEFFEDVKVVVTVPEKSKDKFISDVADLTSGTAKTEIVKEVLR